MREIKHFIRFGSHRESKIFKYPPIKNKLTHLTLNANVVAHTPASIYELIYVNFPHIQYFIDPQTYILQLDPIEYYSTEKEKKTVLKNSVDKLLKEYGNPANTIADTLKPLDIKDFSNNLILEELTNNVLKFQMNFLINSYKDLEKKNGYSDYDGDSTSNILSPLYLIPPYFFISLDNDDWLDVNIRALKYTLEKTQYDKSKIAAQIVIDKSILFNTELIKKICKEYNNSAVKTIIIWIDSFDETEVSEAYLNKFIEFINLFKNKEIINLYGGYFSLILSKKGILNGFCHGPGYGEARGVKPVGGGIPTAKYYLSFIAKRIDFELSYLVFKAKDLFNKKYFNEVCNCDKCKQLLTSPIEEKFYQYGEYTLAKSGLRDIPTEKTLENNQCHYILKRLTDIEKLQIDKEKKIFQDFIEWNKTHKIVPTKHIENWLKHM